MFQAILIGKNMKPDDFIMIEKPDKNYYGTIVSIEGDKAMVKLFSSRNDEDNEPAEVSIDKIQVIRHGK